MSDLGYQIHAMTSVRFRQQDAERSAYLAAKCRRSDPDENTSALPACEVCSEPVVRDRHHPIQGAAVCRDCQRKGWRGGSTCECGAVLHKRDYASCCKTLTRATMCGECRRSRS